jgi:quinol monooxygenase YgiN
MIIITSEVRITPQHWEEALGLAQVHVEASRKEAGCISHRYLLSPEVENCIFFYEEWKDREAIDYHFKQEYSKAISKHFGLWSTDKIEINFHQVEN